MAKQFHLAAFLMATPVTHSQAEWRHPRDQRGGFLSSEFYQDLARILERGKFDFVFFADILAVPGRYGDGISTSLSRGTQSVASIDPAYAVAVMSAVTRDLGLGITRSATYFAPYDLARTFASLDHLSNGRIAWNVVASHQNAEAQNFGHEGHMEHDERYERAEEYLELAFKLWDSWDEDALVIDKEAGLFADPSKIRHVNHAGKWFKSRGPLSTPRSPQGRPVIIQAGSSSRGKEFAARWAEAVFVIDPTSEGRKNYYDDLKTRVARYGRRPDEIKVLPSLIPFVGETESIAREKQAYHNALADPLDGLICLSGHLDHDLSIYPLDEPVRNLDVPGIRGQLDLAYRLSEQQQLTLRDIGKLYAQGVLLPQVVGTAAQVADELEAWFDNSECDGFVISPAYLPGTFEEFVSLVVPELQRRGLHRKEYTGRTLRDRLGLGPASLTPPPRPDRR